MTQPREKHTTGLYIDIENLTGRGQQVIYTLLDDWPQDFPPPVLLHLYTQANHATMWLLWATQTFPDLEVRTSGTQHFNQNSSHNSADIAMAVHAMADLLQQRVTHVAVFSDDCDFISLYQAILDEPSLSTPRNTAPFLWVLTDRTNSVSAMVRKFFPTSKTHTVPWPPGISTDDPIPGPDDPLWTQAADLIAQKLPPGHFRSTEALGALREHWPNHPLSHLDGGAFGQHMATRIWPLLQPRGVTRDGHRFYLPPGTATPESDPNTDKHRPPDQPQPENPVTHSTHGAGRTQ